MKHFSYFLNVMMCFWRSFLRRALLIFASALFVYLDTGDYTAKAHAKGNGMATEKFINNSTYENAGGIYLFSLVILTTRVS